MKDAKINTNRFTNPFNIGTVVDNNDPTNSYRVRVRIDVIHDNIADNKLPWAARVGPTFMGFGSADIDHAIPEVGTKVLTMFVANDPNSILYLGTLYKKNAVTPAGEKYLGSYGIYTKNGEFIGVDKIKHVLKLLWSGNIVVENQGDITVKNSGKLELNIDGKIKIGSQATQPAVLGDDLTSLLNNIVSTFNTHTHKGNLGFPTSSTETPIEFQPVISKKVTVE